SGRVLGCCRLPGGAAGGFPGRFPGLGLAPGGRFDLPLTLGCRASPGFGGGLAGLARHAAVPCSILSFLRRAEFLHSAALCPERADSAPYPDWATAPGQGSAGSAAPV